MRTSGCPSAYTCVPFFKYGATAVLSVQQDKTTWVDCAYWTDRTAVAPYLQKGTQVFVEGQPEARSFQRNDGTPGSSLSLRVREVQLLGGKSDRGVGGSYQPAAAATSSAPSSNVPSPNEITEPVDDLPF